MDNPRLAGRYQGILEALPLAEIAVAIPFLNALSDVDRTAIHAWFTAYYHWLTDPRDSGPRLAALARDSKSHHGTSWMLQACACAWLAAPTGDVGRSEDSALADLRHRFKPSNASRADLPGRQLPREITSPTAPYRDSLFNLDLLAAICQLLSTRLESVWDYQLEEGPGMRAAIAWHFPLYGRTAAAGSIAPTSTTSTRCLARRASLLLRRTALSTSGIRRPMEDAEPGPAFARSPAHHGCVQSTAACGSASRPRSEAAITRALQP